jgi:phosphodiesterase/alkaline phosphatase D-like protein
VPLSRRLPTIAAALAFVCAGQSAASAQTVLTNLTGSQNFINGVFLGTVETQPTTVWWKAVGMTVGPDPLDFLLLRAVLGNTGRTAQTVSGGIYTDAGGNPGAQVVPFVSQSLAANTAPTLVTFNPSSAAVLQPGQTYWFALTAEDITDVATGARGVGWFRETPEVVPAGANGVTFGGYRYSVTAGNTWNDSPIRVSLEVLAGGGQATAPEPGTFLMAGIGLLGLLSQFIRRGKRGTRTR